MTVPEARRLLVHVHHVLTAALAGAPLETLWRLLSDDERDRAMRHLLERGRALSVSARALARLSLSRAAGGLAVAPQEFVFAVGEHGKPEVAAPARATGLRFNVSHTDGMAVCAVAWSGENGVDSVGIDVETLDRKASFLAIAGRSFSPREAREVASAPEECRPDLFFRTWTLKEAYVKALGSGLTHPLDSFWFEEGERGPSIRFAPGASDDPAPWTFVSHDVPPRYRVAVAVRTALPWPESDVSVLFHPEGMP